MKSIFLIACVLTLSMTSTAAEKKKSTHTRSTATVAAAEPSHSDSYDNSITAELGFKQSALNFGVTYVRDFEPVGVGGYFFFQTDKKKNDVPRVNQVISFGGLAKFYALNGPHGSAYIAPGFGIHMIKDVYDILDLAAAKSDKTAIGPILKIGAQFAITTSMKIGLEYTQLYNWFEEVVPDYNAGHSSATMTFDF